MPKNNRGYDSNNLSENSNYIPFSEEVQRAVLSIQSKWSGATRLSRAGFEHVPWTPPEVSLFDLIANKRELSKDY